VIALARTELLTERFDQAVAYALEAHDKQKRKGTEVPYAAHLLGVASLVLEAGGSETEAIAALLHDVVEDQGGAERLADVIATFGPEIGGIVEECSAEDKSDGLDWRSCKERYIGGLEVISESALLVSLADKTYNARAILSDLRAIGPAVFDRFNADEPKAQSVIWYYQSLVIGYEDRSEELPRQLLADLRLTVEELADLIPPPSCPECGASKTAPIVYGMPGPELVAKADAGQVILGGCMIGPGQPDYRCGACGHEWPDLTRWADDDRR
jgi:hypothetical protein